MALCIGRSARLAHNTPGAAPLEGFTISSLSIPFLDGILKEGNGTSVNLNFRPVQY